MSPRFSSPPDPKLFNHTVWEIACQVPAGRVSTYGQIAAMIPPPGGMLPPDYAAWGARWVGGAMASCPDNVPWQRIINSQGAISQRPGPGPARQRQMLEEEGVVFDEKGRVDLARFGWEGPDAEWIKAHGLLPAPTLGKKKPKQLSF